MTPRLFVWTLLDILDILDLFGYIGRIKKKEKSLSVGKKKRKLHYDFGMSQ